VQIFKQQTGLFKSALLTGDIYLRNDLRRGQDIGESIHNLGGLCTQKNRPAWGGFCYS
jgi:hypothetical protein